MARSLTLFGLLLLHDNSTLSLNDSTQVGLDLGRDAYGEDGFTHSQDGFCAAMF